MSDYRSQVDIRLSGGDPDFEAPPHVKEAAIAAIREGGPWTHYSFSGVPEFKEAVVEYYSKYGVKYDPSNVYPTAGSSPALMAVIANLLGPGDECVVFDPTFGTHFRTPPLFGATVSHVPLDVEGFHMDPDTLRKKVSDRSKLMILCNPNNPAGTVYTRKELQAIADVAAEHDIVVLADEIYNEFVYDDRKHIAFPSLSDMKERTVVVMSFSKNFAMTGWRLGYYIAPDALAEKLGRLRVAAAPTTFVQKAGAAALTGPYEPVKEMREEYDKRRRYFVKRLNELDGISCHMFEGAFYAYPDIKELGIPSAKFVEEFAKKEKVLLSDGSRFGPEIAPGHLRIPLVLPVEVLETVATRMERYLKTI
ncbi:aminotransferase class I/II-fold pyridoxal phosphate-dependent enzyme [Candidatus Bathyarchaeota archaeon]|nr:aminotransferase class I/II-fold pyridoxal phosphate-dependent enzyme [Candidatus Bathyarchaeota archaeon]